jgi:predicted amidohydrolase
MRGARTKVAVVQMTSTDDVEANLLKVERFVAQAADEERAGFVVLPECFAYLGPEQGKFALAEALPEGGPILARMARLAEYPTVIQEAGEALAPHALAFWLKDFAAEFHGYYNAERFLVDDAALRGARLALLRAVGQVLRNGLALIGVSAPERM